MNRTLNRSWRRLLPYVEVLIFRQTEVCLNSQWYLSRRATFTHSVICARIAATSKASPYHNPFLHLQPPTERVGSRLTLKPDSLKRKR